MHWLEIYLTNLGHYGIYAGLIFVVSFAALSMLGLPLIPFALAAGVLFGWGWGLAGVVTGSTIGAATGFITSRYIARQRFEKILAKQPKFAAIDRAIRSDGWKIVGLLRMCPLPFGLSNYCYGLTSVRFDHYLIATIAGMLPGEIVFVYLGAAGKQMLTSTQGVHDSPAAKALFYLGVFAAVLLIVVLRQVVGKTVVLDESAPDNAAPPAP